LHGSADIPAGGFVTQLWATAMPKKRAALKRFFMIATVGPELDKGKKIWQDSKTKKEEIIGSRFSIVENTKHKSVEP
jgi:hypothetical protein